MRATALVLAFAPFFAPDLDVGVPPGTPLEWGRELRLPAPTGYRGRVPPPAVRGGTVVQERYLGQGSIRLYDYFDVSTIDITKHVRIHLPVSTGLVSTEDRRDDVRPAISWNYPPKFPAELLWIGTMAALRRDLHPAVVSSPQVQVYCLEIGEPAVAGFKGFVSDGDVLRNVIKPLPPGRPEPPASKDPREAMFLKLATMELSGGFPHALDPTYARRTLALGDDGYGAVLACTKSEHTFLARNAVAILAQYPTAGATEELKKLRRESKDEIIRVRAAMGLIRRREGSILPELVEDAGKDSTLTRTLAIWGLGFLGDPAGAKPAIDLLASGPGQLASTVIPALGRMRGGRDALIAYEAKLRRDFEGSDDVRSGPELVEPPESSTKLLRQMCVIALAMNGVKEYVDEMNKRVADNGLGGFHRATHFLLLEALGLTEEGSNSLRWRVLDATVDNKLRAEALRSLTANKRISTDELRKRALDAASDADVRVAALTALADRDDALAGETCARIVDEYAEGRLHLPGLVTLAAEIGGRRGYLEVATLIKGVERAFAAGAYGRREGSNELDLTQAQIRIHPPLLETLTIELGRVRKAESIAVLQKIIEQQKQPQGRAEAVLALGAIAGRESDDVLVRVLEDRDGWVRYCAYKALMLRTGQDNFCDWMFGGEDQRRPAIQAYRATLK